MPLASFSARSISFVPVAVAEIKLRDDVAVQMLLGAVLCPSSEFLGQGAA